MCLHPNPAMPVIFSLPVQLRNSHCHHEILSTYSAHGDADWDVGLPQVSDRDNALKARAHQKRFAPSSAMEAHMKAKPGFAKSRAVVEAEQDPEVSPPRKTATMAAAGYEVVQ